MPAKYRKSLVMWKQELTWWGQRAQRGTVNGDAHRQYRFSCDTEEKLTLASNQWARGTPQNPPPFRWRSDKVYSRQNFIKNKTKKQQAYNHKQKDELAANDSVCLSCHSFKKEEPSESLPRNILQPIRHNLPFYCQSSDTNINLNSMSFLNLTMTKKTFKKRTGHKTDPASHWLNWRLCWRRERHSYMNVTTAKCTEA